MEPIRTRLELFIHLESIHFWENMLPTLVPDRRPLIEEHIIEKKRSCRKWMRENRPGNYEDQRRTISSDFDSAIVLIPLPERISCYESAEAWFEDHEYTECIPSQYDCTGQLFTAWHKIIERNGRFYAYHCICMDI